MVIRELLIRLGLQGTEQTGRDLDKIDGKVHSVTESFRGLGTVLTGLLAGISIKSIIDVADEMQNLRSQIGNSTGDMDNAASKLDELTRHANDGRVSVEAYTGSWAKMNSGIKQFGGDADDTTKFMDTLSAAFVSNGTATESANAALFQLSQTMQGGVVQGEEMNSLIDAQGELFNDIAKAIAGNVQNYKKMQSQGLVTAEMLLKAVNQFYDKYTSRVKTMPMTVQQSLTIIGNNWKLFTDRLNRESQIIPKIAGMFLWMSNKAEYAMQIVIDALGGAERAVELLGSVLGGLALVGSIYALRSAFAALASPIGLVAIAAAALYLAFDEFRTWQRGGDSVLGDLLGDYEDYRPTIEKITAALNSFKDIVGGWKTIFATFAAYLAGAWLSSVLRTLGIVSSAAAGASAGVSTAGVVIAAAATGYKAYSGITDAATSADKTESLWDSIKRRWNYGGWYNNQQANMSQGIGFSPQSIGRGQLIYNPTVNLTVNSPSGTPEDIKKAVDEAMSGQLPKIQDSFSSDLLFSGRVR